jgi:hypothetical protein
VASVLLVNGQGGRQWAELLRRAASSVGLFLDYIDHQHIEGVSFRDYELVVLDSGAISKPKTTVQMILSSNPLARIVVVSSSPHWKQAREVLLAGATDYVKLVDDEATIAGVLWDNLVKMSPTQRDEIHVRR